jgi:hypothetical protein
MFRGVLELLRELSAMGLDRNRCSRRTLRLHYTRGARLNLLEVHSQVYCGFDCREDSSSVTHPDGAVDGRWEAEGRRAKCLSSGVILGHCQ